MLHTSIAIVTAHLFSNLVSIQQTTFKLTSEQQTLFFIGHYTVNIYERLVWNNTVLLCETAILVKGKSFLTFYINFFSKQLMEKALAREFSLIPKGICFRDKRYKEFPFGYKSIFN